MLTKVKFLWVVELWMTFFWGGALKAYGSSLVRDQTHATVVT